MNAVNLEVVTSGGTAATNIVITDAVSNQFAKRAGASISLVTFFIKVLTGTVQFGVGAIDADAKGWTSSDTIPPITCGKNELYFKAASGADTFVISS